MYRGFALENVVFCVNLRSSRYCIYTGSHSVSFHIYFVQISTCCQYCYSIMHCCNHLVIVIANWMYLLASCTRCLCNPHPLQLSLDSMQYNSPHTGPSQVTVRTSMYLNGHTYPNGCTHFGSSAHPSGCTHPSQYWCCCSRSDR